LRELGEVGELTEGVFGIAPMFTHDEPFVEDGIFGKAAILEVQAGNVRPKTDDVSLPW
jgi:hypothetical protein